MNELQSNVVTAKVGWRDTLAGGFAAIKRVVSDTMRRSVLRGEIAAMDRAGTLDPLLDDLGLTRWEVERIARQYPEAERLLPSMAYHQGVDLDKIDAHSLYDLRHTCSLCDAHRQCRHFLAQSGAGTADFCPNAALFDKLGFERREQAARWQ